MTTGLSPAKSSEMAIEQTLLHEATDLLLACLGSIPRDKIAPKKYWSQAQKALRVGAERAPSFERLVSVMHDTLMDATHPFTAASCKAIYSVGESVKSKGEWDRFRQICREQGPYIILYARVRKEEQKTSRHSDWIDYDTEE